MKLYECIMTRDAKWSIFETASDQVVRTFESERDARKYVKFMSSGGGFAGFTPSFIIPEVKIVEDKSQDIDDEFSEFVSK